MIYNFDGLTFQILTINIFKHEKGFFRVKGRPYAALSFRISGSGYFEINDTQLTSNAGDTLFIPEGADYNVTYTGGESIVVHLINCNYTDCEVIAFKNSEFLRVKFIELLDNWQKLHQINDAKASIFRILQSIADMRAKHITDHDFDKCISFINENFCNCNIGVPDICRAGNISEATLRRKFLLFYGISPKQYLIKLRLNKAIKLLVSGEFSVKEISQMCGFNDEKYFSRIVKDRYSVPPSAFYKGRG